MYDNYNYPPSADTPDAPWNEVEPPEVDFNIEATVSLCRVAEVTTNAIYLDDDTYRICEDYGEKGAYKDTYASIPELLDELVKYIDGEMQGDISGDRRCELQRLKDSATGWRVDDEYYDCF